MGNEGDRPKGLREALGAVYQGLHGDPLKFGRIAVINGFISPAILQEALQIQKETPTGQRPPLIGQILLKRGWLTVAQFLDVLKAIHQETSESDFGARLGRFQIHSELGRGGMGVVYKAFDPSVERQVALKVVNEVDPALLLRLEQEAKLAGKLRHPGIVSIFEMGEIEGIHFIVMEYVEGRPLDQAVVGEGIRRRMELLQKVAAAVGYMHGQNIVHRDLKPSNVLVRPDGEPVVTDFGLARSLDRETRLTGAGTQVGTPAYMSPEQVEGKIDQVGPRSDVHSLGVMMYQLITDRLPFSGSSAQEIYPRILEGCPDPLRRLVPNLQPVLEAICQKAMALSPADRYSHAGEMDGDLHRWLRGTEVRAKPEGIPTRAFRWIRRNWIAVAVVFLGLAGAGIYAWTRLTESSRRAHALVKEIDTLLQDYERTSPEKDQSFLVARLLTAVAELQVLADKGTKIPGIRARLGKLYYTCGKFEAAEREYQLAVRENPNEASSVFGLGKSQERLGKIEPAIQSFERVVSLDPNNAEAWEALGRKRLSSLMPAGGTLQDFERTLEAFDRGIQLKPGAPLLDTLYEQRAWTYQSLFVFHPDHDAKHDWLRWAEEDVRQVLRLRGESTRSWSGLGRVLGLKGRAFELDRNQEGAFRSYDEAAEAYDKAEALGPLEEADRTDRATVLRRREAMK